MSNKPVSIPFHSYRAAYQYLKPHVAGRDQSASKAILYIFPRTQAALSFRQSLSKREVWRNGVWLVVTAGQLRNQDMAHAKMIAYVPAYAGKQLERFATLPAPEEVTAELLKELNTLVQDFTALRAEMDQDEFMQKLAQRPTGVAVRRIMVSMIRMIRRVG